MLSFIKKLRLFRAAGIIVSFVLLYYLLGSVYYTFFDTSEQNQCRFNAVSDDDYSKMKAVLTYDIDDFKLDYLRVLDKSIYFSADINALIKTQFNKNIRKVMTLDELAIYSHAFMTSIGFYHYRNSKATFFRYDDRTIRTNRVIVYKILKSKVVLPNAYGFIVRTPMTITITLLGDRNSNNAKLGSLGLLHNRDLLSSRAINFGQAYTCSSW